MAPRLDAALPWFRFKTVCESLWSSFSTVCVAVISWCTCHLLRLQISVVLIANLCGDSIPSCEEHGNRQSLKAALTWNLLTNDPARFVVLSVGILWTLCQSVKTTCHLFIELFVGFFSVQWLWLTTYPGLSLRAGRPPRARKPRIWWVFVLWCVKGPESH